MSALTLLDLLLKDTVLTIYNSRLQQRALPAVQWQLVVVTLAARDHVVLSSTVTPAGHVFYSDTHSAAQTPAAAAAVAPTPR